MTSREFLALARWERRLAIREAAGVVNAELGLYGVDQAPISEITEADDADAVDRAAERLLTPECRCRRCDHPFPARFVRRAGPAVRRLARLVKYGLAL